MAAPSALPSYRRSAFPPIPGPLQRLFDLVPLVVYPANALPGDECYDDDDDNNSDNSSDLPSLFVFIDPADARRGRASFNPTCLKWQTYLRLAGVPVRLVASSNHASPSGALPFLQPPRPVETTTFTTKNQPRHRTRLPPPPLPIPTSGFAAYAKKTRQNEEEELSPLPLASLPAIHARAPAYQALLDTSLRRAWLHAVYIEESCDGGSSSIASRLYADAASSSAVVRASLAGQLQTAAAAQVWGPATTTTMATATPTATAVAQIYRDAEVALSALDTLLGENDDDDGQDTDTPFFFNSTTPTLFDAAVFSYTHLLLEDDDAENAGNAPRFRWHNTTLPDMVKAHPRLVRHRNRIATQYWDAA